MTSNPAGADMKIPPPVAAPRFRQVSKRLGVSGYGIHKAVAELQDRYQAVQKRTFTRWMNSHLCKWRPPLKVEDLFEDIKDGTKLIALLQILSGERLTTETSRLSKRVGFLTNIQTAIQFLDSKKIKLVNINPADVVDGKPSIVLGLVWSIILFFQIRQTLLPILSIEELTNKLPLSGELSTSTSSLDSMASGPQQRRKTKGVWKGAAKKALLHWVKKKTASNPDGFNVAVKDFGPSWRDGKAFNKMIYTIRPELVDPQQIINNTNKENLEFAFNTAEKHLGIPRLLEPEDVDVDRPDEKSIMTYVAQFVKEFPHFGDEEHDEVPNFDEDTLQYEEIMEWLHKADEKLAGVHKGFRYRNQDYADRLRFQEDFDKFDDRAQLLREKWSNGQTSSISEQQMGELEKLLDKIETSGKKWHRELDSRLPGQLGEVGAWLHYAEGVLSKKSDPSPNSEESADHLKKQMEEHRSVFKNKKIMDQMFQRSRNTRTSRSSAISSVPPAQLDDLNKRLTRVGTESSTRMAELEFVEAKAQSEAFLAAADSMTKMWNVKCGMKQAVDDLLQSYQETILKPNMLEKFKFVGEKLEKTGEAYLSSYIAPEKKGEVRRVLDERVEKINAVCHNLQNAQNLLEEASARWNHFDQSTAHLLPWLDEAEQTIRTKGKDGKEFFNDISKWAQLHAVLNESGNFLANACEPGIAKDVKKRMAAINERWKKVQAVCKGYVREEEIAKMREEFKIGVHGLQGWLDTVESSIAQSLTFEENAVRDHLQDMEDIRGEMHQAEDKYKEVNKIAQGLVKETPKEGINNMLATMTEIKNRLIKARSDVNASIEKSKEMLGPLEHFLEDVESVENWVSEAQELINDYGNSDKDVESLYQKHQQFFAKTKPEQDKLARIGQALEQFKRHALPGMDVAQLQDRVTEVSAKFQLSVKQANEWKPKLKSGTDASREFKKHLGAIQRWLQHADVLLNKPLEQDTPRKLMKEHQGFFGNIDPALLSSFLNAGKKLQASQISDSQRSKSKGIANEVQHEYSSALKQATHRALKLKFLEAADEFEGLIRSCNKHLNDEDQQLKRRTKSNEEILERHKKTFDNAFLQFDKMMNSLEELHQSLQDAVPNDYTWGQKLTELRERYEDVVSAEEEMYLKLTELPEKWEEFNKKMDQAKTWVREAEAVMDTVHKRVEPDREKFNELADKFHKVSSAKDSNLDTLEWLRATLSDLAKHSPPEQIEKHRETLMRLASSSKSVMNALPVTERRIESVQNCLEYKSNIQESLAALDREIQKLEKLSDQRNMKPIDSLEDALKSSDEFQEEMSALDALSTKVTDEISLGEELHSDEQSPAFLYSEVDGLRRKWEKLQDAAAVKEKELEETVRLWQDHENLLNQIRDFVSRTAPILESRLRLSNLNGINQEIRAKEMMQDQVDHALKGMELAGANMDQLSARMSKEGIQKLKEEHDDINAKLLQLKAAVDDGISKVKAIKQEWNACDEEMDSISKWTKDIQKQITQVERSQETPENQFSAAQELAGVILAKSHELTQLEEKLGNIEGLETPTTLHAKLANVRNEWEQALSRVRMLVTSLGENLSHQEKFESTAQQVEENLTAAVQELEKDLEPCVSSEDVQEQKDQLLKFSHSLEQVKLGLTTLQSEAKLLKDPSKAQARKQKLQQKYTDILNQIRARSHSLDDAISKWQQYEKRLYSVKQFIDKCDEIVSADNGALPGDPQKLQLELQTADKLCNEIPSHKNALQDLRDFVDDIDRIAPVDIAAVMAEINEMDAVISEFPQQFADRQRIVSAALASHLQYNDTIDTFTSWLMNFEKSLRLTTDVYLEEVPLAVEVIKVCIKTAKHEYIW